MGKLEPWFRLLALCVCLTLLIGLFILGGMGWPASPDSPYDGAVDEFIEDPEAVVGEHIETTGIVVDAEANEVGLEDDVTETSIVVELAGQEADLDAIEDGQDVTFFGTIAEEDRIVVEPNRLATREPWERQYMYAISLVGALLTALFGFNYWRINLRQLRFEPRTQALLPLLGRDQ